MKSIITLVKTTDKGNAYGWDRIEFLSFNFDAKGFALALCDGEPNVFHANDVETIMTGFHAGKDKDGKEVVYESPKCCRVEDDEHELAVSLDNYTDPNHPEYDAEFDAKIRELRPDWFANE
jgi:hypothetical protein